MLLCYRSRCLFALLQLAYVHYILELSQPLSVHTSSTCEYQLYSYIIAIDVWSRFFNLLVQTTLVSYSNFWFFALLHLANVQYNLMPAPVHRSSCLITFLQDSNVHYILKLWQPLFGHYSSTCKCAQHSEAIAAAVSSLIFNLLIWTMFLCYRSRCLFALLQLANVRYILKLSRPLSLHSSLTC
jgi:hypothetical protein